MNTINDAICEVERKIGRERSMIHGARAMEQLTKNQVIHQQLRANIKEAEKNIAYLEERLQKLRLRQAGVHSKSSTSVSGLSTGNGQDSEDKSKETNSQPPLTNLDIIKYDTPITIAKISVMLQQLEFKLTLEKQFREGIDKMAKLYQREGDKRSIFEAETKRVESAQKIKLLQQALKRYHDLHIEIDEDDLNTGTQLIAPNIRRPQSGTLTICIGSLRNVNHSSTSITRTTETVAVIKIEDVERSRTRPSRNDKFNEAFDIDVEKANEVEIVVYDKKNDKTIPIALLWIRLSDLVEQLRRKKIEQEISDSGWVSADKMDTDPLSKSTGNRRSLLVIPKNETSHGSSSTTSVVSPPVSAWFSMEPVGQIYLSLNFVKHNLRKRPFDAGLGRQGAIRARKDTIHEVFGHKFVQQQFYQIMRCAFCGEFLKNTFGMQCEDCHYTCHKKCYPKVVVKCISKPSDGTENEYEKINHRIPHHFEAHTNIGANWCCHCGYILPLGKKVARKCTECGVTAHVQCMHLVPDFCGMSMEMANRILYELRTTKPRKTPTATRSASIPSTPVSKLTSKSEANHAKKDSVVSTTSLISPLAPTQQSPPPVSTPVSVPVIEISSPPSLTPAPSIKRKPIPPGDNEQPLSPYSIPQAEAETPKQDVTIVDSVGRPVQATDANLAKTLVEPSKVVGLDSFNFISVLGKGNFGKVMLAESKKTKNLFAIKVLKKSFILENDEIESIKSEKRVFLVANREKHPFLLNLHSCFQTETRIFFVMDYVSGGDLMLHIQQEQFYPRRAQFYAAEVCLALKYFHDNGIIYRDLKLDNILLSPDGHIKLADYGLCKENMWDKNTTVTFCGTPEFMAPEILLEQKYTRAVDWWAFGVLIYQMLLGQSPFRGDDEEEIFDAILTDEPLYPIHMPRDSVFILQQLLTRAPEKRLGSGPNDAEDVMAHPFFSNINWDDIYHKRIQPPFVPKLEGPKDTKYFDEEFTSELPILTPIQSTLSPEMQMHFEGFSYISDFDTPLGN
ncbi:AGC/PKC protein kinase Pck2 [Schizosaccharomyces japonicus yFS275]|uniref:protein kinase C n=1 Tax=Schizosaccharomyces japonicus (strain yFS275 / FY16936) TaxID=402676 RepID=B6JW41_SCHJY|nr:AGC/PKC protein kinase Pck2 [Schizosaccharomyces japonicus yFS275]EEB05592.1 AGC/PKC protein kinase Pck2 [Schizosaccharomyces japonicus yFS275]